MEKIMVAVERAPTNLELTARERRWYRQPWWSQAVSVFMMVVLVFTTTPTEVRAQSVSANFLYYVQDHLGSSSIVLDRAGVRVQHYENFAYGNQRYNDSSLGVTHRYTGQVFDEETGLYYYNARYYDPELGRFTQPDTIVPSRANPQTLNRYTYANNSPLVYTDPSGHLVWFAIPLILAAVGAGVGGIVAGVQGTSIAAGMLGGAISGFGAGLGPLGAIARGDGSVQACHAGVQRGLAASAFQHACGVQA